jgi:hypothetical protein
MSKNDWFQSACETFKLLQQAMAAYGESSPYAAQLAAELADCWTRAL